MSSTSMKYGSYSFVPVPIFGWNTETVYDGKLDRTYLKHSVDMTGILLELPYESGALNTLVGRRNALTNALASGGQEWRVDYNNIPIISGIYPRVQSLSFSEGVWADRINYSFSFEYDEDFYNTGIQSYSESWQFDENEGGETASASHTISAVGLNTTPSGTNNSFVNARTYVLSKTGWSNVSSGCPAFVQASGTYDGYEELRSEQADVSNSSFSVTEKFILSSGAYIHTSTAQYQLDNAGIGTVSLDGNIRGLGRGPVAYSRALTGWNSIKTRIPSIASGVYTELGGDATLFTNNSQSFSVSRNPFAGTISYSISYNDSLSENLPSGIQEFSMNVQDQAPTRVYASFPIMERSLGNVVQDIGTSSEGQLTISGTATCKQDYLYSNLIYFVEQKIDEKRPSPVDYVTLRLSSKSVTKDEDKKTISWSLAWTYTKDLAEVPGNDDITL